MTIPEMLKNIKNSNIPDDAYSIGGKFQNESLCMQEKVEGWEIFYYERGLKTGIVIFRNEDKACEYFLEKLTHWFKK